MTNDMKFLSLREAARYANVTRQAIYVAIRKKKLRAEKINRRWCISVENLDDYRINKYNRDLVVFNGEPLFNMEKGEFSLRHVCKVISKELNRPYSMQHLYYLVRTGQLKASKKGGSWVIAKEDAVALLEKERSAYEETNQLRLA